MWQWFQKKTPGSISTSASLSKRIFEFSWKCVDFCVILPTVRTKRIFTTSTQVVLTYTQTSAKQWSNHKPRCSIPISCSDRTQTLVWTSLCVKCSCSYSISHKRETKVTHCGFNDLKSGVWVLNNRSDVSVPTFQLVRIIEVQVLLIKMNDSSSYVCAGTGAWNWSSSMEFIHDSFHYLHRPRRVKTSSSSTHSN